MRSRGTAAQPVTGYAIDGSATASRTTGTGNTAGWTTGTGNTAGWTTGAGNTAGWAAAGRTINGSTATSRATADGRRIGGPAGDVRWNSSRSSRSDS